MRRRTFGVNRSQLPFVLAGKRLDSVRQVDDESLQIVRRTLRSLGLPEIGAKVQILHAKTILFITAASNSSGPGRSWSSGRWPESSFSSSRETEAFVR